MAAPQSARPEGFHGDTPMLRTSLLNEGPLATHLGHQHRQWFDRFRDERIGEPVTDMGAKPPGP